MNNAFWLVLLSLCGSMLEPPVKIAIGDAKRFIGQQVTICGSVWTYGCSKDRDMVYLDLDKPYWAGKVSVGVPSAKRAEFGEQFEDRYLANQLCATGRVERRENRIVVVASEPASLVAASEAEPSHIFAPDAVQSCTPGVQPPKLRREVRPRYTQAALDARIQGRVFLEAVVMPDGTAGDVRVVVSLDRGLGLDEEAIAAVKRWKFAPGSYRGEVVPMIATIELKFSLK